jgi:hypothetical protein
MATKVKLICENCGSEFEVRKGKEKKTCSSECRWMLRKKQDLKYYITKPCENCGNEFISKIKENKKYCSYQCSANAKHKKAVEKRICLECGNEFEERKKHKRKFCSEKCRKKWNNKPENKKRRINKSKKVLEEKYGVDSIFKLESYQKEIQKNRNKKYINNWNIINNKVKQTKKQKYNNENYNNYEKIKKTKKQKYNNENFNNRIKFQNTINNKLFERLNEINYKLIKINDDNILTIKHPDGHIFEIPRSLLILRLNENRELSIKYLPYSPNISNYELEISKFLDYNNIIYYKNRKDIIKPYELDFYLSKYQIAIEFNGLYWHSEYFKDNNYHLNKLNYCINKHIHLIQIFEDEWVHKRKIIESIILNKIGLTKNKIYGRKCNIIEIDNKKYKSFLNENHILGETNSSIRIGLYYNNELVSIMGFKKHKNGYNLNRFSNKINTSVIGGAGKILNYFLKKYKPNKIITFADKRYSDGNLYENLGFNFLEDIKPSYWYCDYNNKMKYHKFNFRKKKLNIKNQTEHEKMLENNLPRIYDCGLKKYELIL